LLLGLLLWTAATALVTAAVLLVRRLCGARPRWRNVGWIALASLPVHAFLLVPATLGFLGTRIVRTRSDEAAYRGPHLLADGTWAVQTRASLQAADAPDPLPTPPAQQVTLRASDGVALRAFFVPAGSNARPIDAVLTHGLFRGGLELETVGRMLRDLGCDVLLLEMRNHGGSARAPASFGPREALDVRAAATWFDARQGAAGRRLCLFGVSMGAVASMLAAPHCARLHYLVLDAPVIDPLATAQRMLARGPRHAGGRLGIPEPFARLTIFFLQYWAGADLAQINALDALRQMPPHLRALVIGGGADERVPRSDIEATFAALSVPAANKSLWIEDRAEHGTVWETAPAAYRAHVARLLE
jgi:hypothetical protein